MVHSKLIVRAVFFDIYQTLLTVEAPPSDAPTQWAALWRRWFKNPPRLTLTEFSAACDQVIQLDHAQACSRGISSPEVYWPDITRQVLPELNALSDEEQADFLGAQAGLWHTVALMPEAIPVLHRLKKTGLTLGLASNCQPYTLRELDSELGKAGLDRSLFAPDLCFLSFEQGFSKPDPYVFQILTTRLRKRNITPAEALMVGDRLDNDCAPARAFGWQTWCLGQKPASPSELGGDWRQFGQALEPFQIP